MKSSTEIEEVSVKKIPNSIGFIYFFLILFFINGLISLLDDFLQIGNINFLMRIRNNTSLIIILLSFPYTFLILKIKKKWRIRFYLLPLFIVFLYFLSSLETLLLIKIGTFGDILSLMVERNLIASKYPILYATFIFNSVMQLSVVALNYKFFKIILRKTCRCMIKSPNSFFDYLVTGVLGGFQIPAYIAGQVIIIAAIIFLGPKGFLAINSTSLVAVEKIYQATDGKIVRLIPMMHIGKEDFYKKISQIDAAEKTLVLAEGVKDDLKELEGLDYSDLANSFGLSRQGEHFTPEAKNEENNNKLFFIAERIKTSDMSAQTISLLKKIFKSFKKNKNKRNDLLGKLTNSNIKITGDEYISLRNDLLDLRTNDLIAQFDKHEGKFKKVIIPWGALHMPDIELALIKRGYIFQSEVKRELIRWDEIFEKVKNKNTSLSRLPASK
jgi:hypothetical protein